MVFESKKDIGVIWIYIGALCGIILGKSVLGAGSLVAVMVIWAVFVAFMITNMYTIRYIITDSELIIKTCMFKKRLKLNRFSTITPVRGGYSFTASSPDQLQLMYLSDTKIRVSPKDVEGFKTGLIMAIKKYKETESANAQ
jgi:hypothetical protein